MIKIPNKPHKSSDGSVTHLISDHRLLITAALALALSGCMGVYDGGFECPPGEGVGCKSISEVNQMVNQCSVPSARCVVPSLQGSEDKIEIWYSPSFDVGYTEQCRRKKVLDAKNSI
jgi:hypothetical protein